MYILNYNPRKDGEYIISLDPTARFWQLIDRLHGGIIAESDSHRRLKKHAELKRLSVKNYI